MISFIDPPPGARGRAQILVVDDDPGVAAQMAAILKDLEYAAVFFG